MSLICTISGEVPDHPCISQVSGCVFERRLLEKYVQEHGVDPTCNEPISPEQIIDIKTHSVIKPKPPSATSIPAILKSLQDEWDACMLNSYTLRQQLQTTRQELAHALYQHDAACRMIARLTKEATAAREALATLKPQAGNIGQPMPQVPAPQQMAVDEKMEYDGEPIGLTDDIIQKLMDKAGVLTTERKKRGKHVPEGLVGTDDIRNYRQVASHPGLHSASVPGILCLDICASDNNRVITGGADKTAVVFDKESEQVISTLKGHSRKVSHVIYHPTEDIAFTCSPDSTIRIWSVQNGRCSTVIRTHKAAVTGISLHALGDYLLSCSEDQHWAFSDIRSGKALCKVTDDAMGSALTCAQFHPDGLIFGTGTQDSQIKIWDLKERTNVANFPGHSGPITDIAFSENGYYLATAADDSVVKLWDLRKLKNFKTLTMDDRYEIKSLTFDKSGTYLAVAGTDIRVYFCKQWQELRNFTEHGSVATGVKFGQNASFIASCSMDRTLKYYGIV
ncbi:pre-mRNA-processing factor 19-like [Styela clava]|uniref:pre-mRNA-processing factor 19-like n=1 Tax=Styela clava TaxID=7725 RepID=UPI001939AB54|nr:pre-mRNA-processing factor 19-like [Styela clava]